MLYQVVTLFPELIEAAIGVGLLGKAVASGVVKVATISPRLRFSHQAERCSSMESSCIRRPAWVDSVGSIAHEGDPSARQSLAQ